MWMFEEDHSSGIRKSFDRSSVLVSLCRSGYGNSDFTEARVLPAWSTLESSPLFKDWDWSPLIHSTLEANGIPPPSNSPSALVRKSLPPMHSWAWKVPHNEPLGSSDGPSDQLPNSRGPQVYRMPSMS